MKIQNNSVASFSYTLEVEGQIIDRAASDHPLDYIHGGHMLIPRLEQELEGKEPGEAFSVAVPPEEAYGEYDPKNRFDIPKDSFKVNGQLREDLMQVGRTIPMLNGAGEVCYAQIIEVKEDGVTVDFNHALAGKTLNFSGTVISVREATEKELKEGLHGEYLPQEGGCHGCHGHCHHDEGEDGCGCGDEGCNCGDEGCGHHGEDGGCCGGHGHCHHN